jgi:tight adherence protein C
VRCIKLLRKFKKEQKVRTMETNKKGEKIRVAPLGKLSMQLTNKYVKKDIISRIDRGIKTVGGVDIDIPGTTGGIKMLFFTARNVYEYFAALVTYAMFTLVVLLYGMIAGASPAGPLLIGFALVLFAVQRYRKPLKEFKARFEAALPAFIDTMVQGLAIDMPVEQVIEYITRTDNSIIAPFVRDIYNNLMSGMSLERALEEVAEKTLSPDFERIARLLSFRSETTAEMVRGLEQIRDTIETRLETQILAKANNMENAVILPIMAGYVLPYLVVILYPLLTDLIRFFSSTAF